MTYNAAIANISRDEFDQLMAIVRKPPDEARPRTPEDLWRQSYKEKQQRKIILGFQQDLFDAKPRTHFRRNAPAPHVERPPNETIEAKLARIAGDPHATFGPQRADRPATLTPEEKAAIIRGAANWLRVSQRVRIIDAPGCVDPAFGPQRFLGRAGAIWRLCSQSFAEHCYVFLDPVGGERTFKIEMVELRDLEPLA